MYGFSFNIGSTAFKKDLKNITCYKNLDYANILGNAIRNTKYGAALCAIGETYERNALIEYNHIQNKTIDAFSLLDNTVYNFSLDELKQKNIFFDSCGCAAHVNSNSCLENAFFEFLERQSFIFWYLSKGKSYKIDKSILHKYNSYNIYFNNFECYEISLLKSFYVVFFIGELKGKIAVSLGSGKNLNTAIISALNELHQMYFSLLNSISIDDSKPKDYAETYLSIAPERIKKAFDFINENAVNYTGRIEKQYISINNEVKLLNQKYKMNPLVSFLPLNETKINNIKVCKIFDLNWFPSLLPKTFDKKTYDFIESVTGKTLDRRCTYIPFP
ncbi:YcaO-like family protein [Treponema putidum]|uniref:YcaO-like family protein n=1 Tax=Treponema putidum TaxID=221027 RepID=UPI0004F74E37|nr:YcaO-like family protein [Treponema putidum]AIN94396.1 hypothetical protein JO40_10060 [Treponema putidum]TWI73157.1 YcaO-like family protein [Treponema putidum]UTY30829.1 hypothetical protein E4N75_04190 [Treponema putidum]